MGADQPFMYNNAQSENSRQPYSSFDPKAISRASLTPKAPRPKQEGPLLSFNRHPDSYFGLPYGNTTAKPMNPSVKKWITYMRVVQLVLRLMELLSAIGLLVTMILITQVEQATGWIIRIPPGVAMIHTVYAVYHLSRKPSGRTPASSASYMLFAAAFDVSIIPFYAFSALVAWSQYSLGESDTGWATLLGTGQSTIIVLIKTAFLCATVGAGLHSISLGLSIWLAVIFRKITRLPPDMNPLEENLTSRHKRNKSSISVSTASEKRLSEPLESKRNSRAPYEDLSRPPTIPFLHTRTNSTDSLSTYHSTPPGSRDSRLDLPSRQYQLQPNANSPNSSASDLKRSSYRVTPTSSKRSSYAELPSSENAQQGPRDGKSLTEAWQTAQPLSGSQRTRTSPRKAAYHPLHQRFDLDEDISLSAPHPHPLAANPPTPRQPIQRAPRKSALTEIGLNDNCTGSGDLADEKKTSPQKGRHGQEHFKAKYYGELRAGTPPIFVGSGKSTGSGRQVSSGNDFMDIGAYKSLERRDVSGKIAEEGRGGSGNRGWGTRLRKISGH